jgi:hypothetical protein
MFDRDTREGPQAVDIAVAESYMAAIPIPVSGGASVRASAVPVFGDHAALR